MPEISSMRKLLVLPAALLLVSLASFRITENRFKYSSSEGHFLIEFPGRPTETIQDDTSDIHKPLRIHFATYFPSDTEGYMADWIDLSRAYPKGKTMKQLLEGSRDGALRSVKATEVTTTEINLGTIPYIEFTFKNTEVTGKGRIYIINKFQYSILTLFSVNAGINAKADKFIHSFRHAQ